VPYRDQELAAAAKREALERDAPSRSEVRALRSGRAGWALASMLVALIAGGGAFAASIRAIDACVWDPRSASADEFEGCLMGAVDREVAARNPGAMEALAPFATTISWNGDCGGGFCGTNFGRTPLSWSCVRDQSVVRLPRGRARRDAMVRARFGEIVGALAAERVRRVVQRHLPEVRSCYEQALECRPHLEGSVTARFMVASTGDVLAAVTESTVGDNAAEECVATAVRRWTFPRSQGVTVVSQRFVLLVRP